MAWSLRGLVLSAALVAWLPLAWAFDCLAVGAAALGRGEEEDCDAIVALQTASLVHPSGQAAPGHGGWALPLALPAAAAAPRAAAVAAAAPWSDTDAGEQAVLRLAQDLSREVARSRAVRGGGLRLREALQSERIREVQARQELALLHANATRLHRAISALAVASTHGGGLGTHDRKAMLLSLAGACGTVVIIAVLGCACAASSARKGRQDEARARLAPEAASAAADAMAADGGEAPGASGTASDLGSTAGPDVSLATLPGKRKRWRQGKLCACGYCLVDTSVWFVTVSVTTIRNTPMCLYDFMFGCSPQICIASWIFAIIWGSAMAWLWHMGVVQPYLQQLLVYVYFVLGLGSLVLISVLEYFQSFQVMFHTGYKTVMKFHDKIDDALESIGLDYLESEQDRLDAAQAAEHPSRHVEAALARSEERRAADAHRKPAPGTPAWVLSNLKRSKGGCC